MEFMVCFIVKGYVRSQSSAQKNGLLNAGKKPAFATSTVYRFLRVRLSLRTLMYSKEGTTTKKEVCYVHGL